MSSINKNKIREYKPNIAIAPGETIKEYMEEKDITQEEMSEYLNLSINEFRRLLEGKISISKSIADLLEKKTLINKSFWINLQVFFDKTKKRLKYEKRISRRKLKLR